MTNHETTIQERERASSRKEEVRQNRNSRKRERQDFGKKYWLSGSLSEIHEPDRVLYYPWVVVEHTTKRGVKYNHLEKAEAPEIFPFISRKWRTNDEGTK